MLRPKRRTATGNSQRPGRGLAPWQRVSVPASAPTPEASHQPAEPARAAVQDLIGEDGIRTVYGIRSAHHAEQMRSARNGTRFRDESESPPRCFKPETPSRLARGTTIVAAGNHGDVTHAVGEEAPALADRRHGPRRWPVQNARAVHHRRVERDGVQHIVGIYISTMKRLARRDIEGVHDHHQSGSTMICQTWMCLSRVNAERIRASTIAVDWVA